jgi:mannitol/fructose-specific phosphotransferase system IIA component (Ntr-type)
MLLSKLLRPELIIPRLHARDKHQAIAELLDLLVQHHDVSLAQRHPLLEELEKAEAAHPSGMERGIAIPHCLTERVEDILCALGIVPDGGIPFDCLDGKPATLVVLLLLPRRNFTGEVQAIAGIEHLLEHENLHERLLRTSDAQTAFDLIEAEENR